MSEHVRNDDNAWIDRVVEPVAIRTREQSALWREIVEFSLKHPSVPVADAVRNVERDRV